MQRNPPIFVVGTGRCGSTLISEMLALHPDILSLSEVFTSFPTKALVARRLDGAAFWAMLRDSSLAFKKTMTPTHAPSEFTYRFHADSRYTLDTLPACMRLTLPRLCDNPDAIYRQLESILSTRPKLPLQDHYQFWFDWLSVHLGKQLWVERSGSSLTMVRPLLRLFPDARFVHIHRDGRETALSMLNFAPMRLLLHMRRRFGHVGIDIIKGPLRYMDSRLFMTCAPLIEKTLAIEALLEKRPSLREAGKLWSDMVAVGLADLARLPAARVHTMGYADLVADPRSTLRGFINFVAPQLATNADWLDKVVDMPRARPPAWLQLSPQERGELEQTCEKGLRLLGYTS